MQDQIVARRVGERGGRPVIRQRQRPSQLASPPSNKPCQELGSLAPEAKAHDNAGIKGTMSTQCICARVQARAAASLKRSAASCLRHDLCLCPCHLIDTMSHPFPLAHTPRQASGTFYWSGFRGPGSFWGSTTALLVPPPEFARHPAFFFIRSVRY